MTKKSIREAVAAHTERLLSAGGSRVTLKLSPEATKALAVLCKQRGLSRTRVIETLILGERTFARSGASAPARFRNSLK